MYWTFLHLIDSLITWLTPSYRLLGCSGSQCLEVNDVQPPPASPCPVKFFSKKNVCRQVYWGMIYIYTLCPLQCRLHWALTNTYRCVTTTKTKYKAISSSPYIFCLLCNQSIFCICKSLNSFVFLLLLLWGCHIIESYVVSGVVSQVSFIQHNVFNIYPCCYLD